MYLCARGAACTRLVVTGATRRVVSARFLPAVFAIKTCICIFTEHRVRNQSVENFLRMRNEKKKYRIENRLNIN